MNGEEISLKIKEKNEYLHSLINKFMLTPEISKTMNEIAELRVQCGFATGHSYKNGKCQWCGSEENRE